VSLKFLHFIDLPANIAQGGFDHADIFHGDHRLYVAHTVNNAVDVIDCVADRYLYSIAGLGGVAGVLVSNERGLVFTSNRSENTVGIFTPGPHSTLQEDEQKVAKIPVGVRPNGLAFDPGKGLLIAANVGDPDIPGSFTLSIVDIAKQEILHCIPVAGRTRWAIFDKERAEFFVNIANPPQIVVIAADRPERIERILPIPFGGPHGLELDADRCRLLCACDAGRLLALEADGGKVLGAADLSGSPDVIFFNASLKHLYVAVGDPGLIDVFDTDTLTLLETIPTEKGAHTLAFDAEHHKVYAFLPGTHRAEVFIDE
jgi:DNA-binding beta-propeller fold protein YncE